MNFEDKFYFRKNKTFIQLIISLQPQLQLIETLLISNFIILTKYKIIL